MPVYLDYNATAPVYPEVAERMQALLALPANPSSVHSFGREAKKHLEQARRQIADAISAWPNEVVFTASGTEANITVLRGFPGKWTLASAIEHSSILKNLSPGGVAKEWQIPVDSNGVIDLAILDAMLTTSTSPVLVSIMLANNETGVVQPIGEASGICKKHGALLHCDAAQAIGKIPVDFGALGVDMLTISAHKCGGPVGAAALIVRRDLPIAPLLAGGQESGRRAGTENLPAIAGFAVAITKLSDLSHMTDLRGWLDVMEEKMLQCSGVVFGKQSLRLPNTSCVAMPGVSNEVQLMDFDLRGFAVSAGAACSSGRIEPSHVLEAMGVPKTLSASAIRISGGWQTTKDDILRLTEAWTQTAMRLSKKAS